jgi:hypothetical protein
MKKIFLLCLICLFSSVCISQNLTKVVSVKAKDIKSIGILPVISSVKILHSKKEEITVEEQTRVEAIVNDDTQIMLDELMKKIELSNKPIPLDTTTLKIYTSDFDKILKEVKNTNQDIVFSYRPMIKRIIESFKMSDEMADLIKSNDERYALYTVNQGFTRTRASNTNRQLKNIALLTAGVAMAAFAGFGLVFKEYNTGVTTYAVIVDAETKKIVNFFIYSTLTDPMKADLMKSKQLYPTFKDYWVWYHSEADQYMKIERK